LTLRGQPGRVVNASKDRPFELRGVFARPDRAPVARGRATMRCDQCACRGEEAQVRLADAGADGHTLARVRGPDTVVTKSDGRLPSA